MFASVVLPRSLRDNGVILLPRTFESPPGSVELADLLHTRTSVSMGKYPGAEAEPDHVVVTPVEKFCAI